MRVLSTSPTFSEISPSRLMLEVLGRGNEHADLIGGPRLRYGPRSCFA